MKILYYTWGENSKEDILKGIIESQEQFGYEHVVTQILKTVGNRNGKI